MADTATGPYVQAACFCENIIVDSTGAVSLIRIIDTITHTAKGPEPPEDLPEISYTLKLALLLKAGKATGRSELRIEPETPDGLYADPMRLSIQLGSDESGYSVLTDFTARLTMEGLYWFHIYVDDRHLTSMPLRVMYNRVVTS